MSESENKIALATATTENVAQVAESQVEETNPVAEVTSEVSPIVDETLGSSEKTKKKSVFAGLFKSSRLENTAVSPTSPQKSEETLVAANEQEVSKVRRLINYFSPKEEPKVVEPNAEKSLEDVSPTVETEEQVADVVEEVEEKVVETAAVTEEPIAETLEPEVSVAPAAAESAPEEVAETVNKAEAKDLPSAKPGLLKRLFKKHPADAKQVDEVLVVPDVSVDHLETITEEIVEKKNEEAEDQTKAVEVPVAVTKPGILKRIFTKKALAVVEDVPVEDKETQTPPEMFNEDEYEDNIVEEPPKIEKASLLNRIFKKKPVLAVATEKEEESTENPVVVVLPETPVETPQTDIVVEETAPVVDEPVVSKEVGDSPVEVVEVNVEEVKEELKAEVDEQQNAEKQLEQVKAEKVGFFKRFFTLKPVEKKLEDMKEKEVVSDNVEHVIEKPGVDDSAQATVETTEAAKEEIAEAIEEVKEVTAVIEAAVTEAPVEQPMTEKAVEIKAAPVKEGFFSTLFRKKKAEEAPVVVSEEAVAEVVVEEAVEVEVQVAEEAAKVVEDVKEEVPEVVEADVTAAKEEAEAEVEEAVVEQVKSAEPEIKAAKKSIASRILTTTKSIEKRIISNLTLKRKSAAIPEVVVEAPKEEVVESEAVVETTEAKETVAAN